MPQQGPTVFSGRYELHRKLARGGMAEVFLARDQLLDRPVAIKVLFPEFATNPEFVERFRREAQAAANLSHHPNIVSIYDWGEERGTYFIVMEYVEGRTLADIVRTDGRFHPDRAAEIAVDVLAALDVAHHAGLVHRDIKPGNIIVSPNGQAKVADFGIATATAAFDSSLTQAGTVMGTATYFSPEQAQGRKVDGRSDLYSLGVVLYEMLVGEPPFTGETPVAIAYKHVQEEPVPPSRRGVSLPPSLEAITLKAMAKNPGVRYPTASDFASDLKRYRSGQHQLKRRAANGAAPAGAAVAAGPRPAGAGPVPVGPRPGPPSGRPAPGPRPGPAGPPTAAVAATRVNTAAPPAPARPASNRPAPPRRDDYYDEPPRYDGRGRTAGFIVALVLLLIVLVALVMAFGKTLGLGGDDDTSDELAVVDLPSFFNLPVDQAQATLAELGLVAELVPELNADFDEGIVFDQTPLAGARVEEGSTVTLRYAGSGNTVVLQSVVNLPADQACAILEGAGLICNPVPEENADVPPAEVFLMDPPAGTEVERGSTVTITVSQGPGMAVVPDVTGGDLNEALAALQELELVPRVQEEGSPTVPEGEVIRTDPVAGTPVAEGEEVVIVVSSGLPQAAVPAVTGLLADSAQSRIGQAGFAPFVTFQDLPAGSADVGRVISQDPPAGTQLAQGGEVRIVVGRETAATTVPPTTVPPTTVPPTTVPPTTVAPA